MTREIFLPLLQDTRDFTDALRRLAAEVAWPPRLFREAWLARLDTGAASN